MSLPESSKHEIGKSPYERRTVGRGRDELVTTWVAPLFIETGREGGRTELVNTGVVKSCGKSKITKYL